MNVPCVCHIYLYQGIATGSMGLETAEKVANLWDFKAYETSGASEV